MNHNNYRRLMDDSLAELNQVFNSLEEKPKEEAKNKLVKAVDNKTWNKILDEHNKNIRSDIVDYSNHIKYFNKTHKEYVDNFLNNPSVLPQYEIRDIIDGITTKMFHKVGNDIYMAKPYFLNIEKDLSHWQKEPIRGWAALTNNKLFEAANLSHLCEDLSAHIHKSVPLFISKFNPNAKSFFHFKFPFDNEESAKIIILDYLTHNQDRNYGNLMYVGTSPFAIDHDRNFQYFLSKFNDLHPNTTPYYSFYNSVFRLKNKDLPKEIENNEELQQNLINWWKERSNDIINEMQKNLQFIKDPKVKEHIEDNFISKWNFIDDYMKGLIPHELFSEYTVGPEIIEKKE